jgi:MoaA/NifB/PqqE/SkfB family radical SAM enzyme
VDVSTDESVGIVDRFFDRPDLPSGAKAFDEIIPLSACNSSHHFDYGLLAEDTDGRLFPLYRSFPLVSQIELDGRCNLACVMCPQAFGVNSGTLSLKDIQALRPVVRQSDGIVINYQGESLLNPYLREFLEIVPPHKVLEFATNGTALKGKASRLLLEFAPPVRMVAISMDASTEESFFRIRGTSLKKIMKNAIMFKKSRDALGQHYPRFRIMTTVLREFMDEIPGIVAYAAELNGDFTYGPLEGVMHGGSSWITPFKGSDKLFVYDEQIPKDAKAWQTMTEKIELEASKFGIPVVGQPPLCCIENDACNVSDCPLLYRQRIYIANGNAQMCCVQTEPMFNWKEFGADRFDEHESVVKARALAAKGVIPSQCSGANCGYIKGELAPSRSEHPLTYIERKFI